jgi:hypothetical protein
VRLLRLGVDLLIAAICAGLAAGFLTGLLIAFVAAGFGAFFTPATLFVAMIGAVYGLLFAGPVALLLGTVLWSSRAHHWLTWAGVGALTGLIYYYFMWHAADGPFSAGTLPLAAAQLASGACTALFFRLTMQTLRADKDEF